MPDDLAVIPCCSLHGVPLVTLQPDGTLRSLGLVGGETDGMNRMTCVLVVPQVARSVRSPAGLTTSQREVVVLVQRSLAERGITPTIREISDARYCNVNATQDILGSLRRKGWLAKATRKTTSRTLRLRRLLIEESRDMEPCRAVTSPTCRASSGNDRSAGSTIHDAREEPCPTP